MSCPTSYGPSVTLIAPLGRIFLIVILSISTALSPSSSVTWNTICEGAVAASGHEYANVAPSTSQSSSAEPVESVLNAGLISQQE